MADLSGQSILVLGAGVVGVSLALTLLRRGAQVTLVEATGPGAACSAGNGGMIQTGSSLPLAQPGILRQVPGMLSNPEGALVLRPARIPAMLPWARHLLRASRPEAAAAGERHLAWLLSGATPAWERLRARSPAADLFRPRGELYVTRNPAVAEELKHKAAVCAGNGIAADLIERGALRKMEPALAEDYAFGLYLPESSYVVNPRALCECLYALFLTEGGQGEIRNVTRVSRGGEGAVLHCADGAQLGASRLVIAAGTLSGRLARGIGLRLMLEPMRGYNVTLADTEELALNGPVIEAEMNIAVTPMQGGPRVAGTLEFAGFRRAPDWKRARILLPLAQRMLPGLARARIAQEWAGERPGTPDSLPLMGPATEASDPIWISAGHGMLGLTLAARSGELIAAGMAGESRALAALEGFRPARFARRPAKT
ncbi:FAD-dependent oxidoreductase [Pseudooceanicola sp. CBS1P-1]|uniref:FAD-dependent oxidoreductase n=1 Tax=Pseudooceanicola albus TaxID=2692189 RepID=A0A6L7GBR3_9RHOB|nr:MULTISPECIES: FAD-dependent oxidoreductase [Pseudooceanicola]MBT9386594.1 FAD-dependent oxidoreductase [Pseudooceanicola endophyticus]MXN20710.1 FAD-dependent oxidoreductase [Pseudooceanicola albus]